MLVWRDKIACHGPIARHIPLSLPLPLPPPRPADIIDSVRFWLPPRHPFMHTFPAIWQTAWRRPRWYARRHPGFSCSCEMNERFEVERPRNRRTNHTWIMLEDLWKERNLWRRLERERERGGIWGKERFYDRWFEDKNVDKSLGGCIGCREGKGCVSSWLDQVMVRITICEI